LTQIKKKALPTRAASANNASSCNTNRKAGLFPKQLPDWLGGHLGLCQERINPPAMWRNQVFA
jgi:hypothetical protein